MTQEEKQLYLEQLSKLNLMSDIFSSIVFEDKGACQYVLRILLSKPDLVVEEVLTQNQLRQINAKTVILDVLATDSKGNKYNIEVQRSDTLEHAKRVRYYASAIDSHYLKKGCDYDKLPDVYIIYISETDIWGHLQTAYTVKKYLTEDVPYDDGLHIMYVNAEIEDDSQISDLMEYFKSADANDMSHGELSERVSYFKNNEGGQETMCTIMNDIRNEGFKQGIQQVAETMLKGNVSIEMVAQYCQLSVEEVEQLKKKLEN